MKLCKDCRFSHIVELELVKSVCIHGEAHLVNYIENEHILYSRCLDMRSNQEKCGLDAKYFQPHIVEEK